MENFHPLHQMPSRADLLTWHIVVPRLCRTAPNSVQNKFCQIYCPFLVTLFFHLFLATSLILGDLFCIFGHFLHHFGLFSQDTCADIPLCAKNSTTWMCRLWHKPYYAGCSPKSSEQSCHYAIHLA